MLLIPRNGIAVSNHMKAILIENRMRNQATHMVATLSKTQFPVSRFDDHIAKL